jgi:hypothetical protein
MCAQIRASDSDGVSVQRDVAIDDISSVVFNIEYRIGQ